MQFCDFDAACAPNGVENELNRLAEKKILSTEQAHAVDKRKIERFFASDLYKTFMAENKVRREFKFSVLVPAQAYFPVAADATRGKCAPAGCYRLPDRNQGRFCYP